MNSEISGKFVLVKKTALVLCERRIYYYAGTLDFEKYETTYYEVGVIRG